MQLIVGQQISFEETRNIEFKEVKGKNPLSSIANTADEYAVAFLNSSGGRIFWGVRDLDRIVVGVELDANERDNLRKIVSNKLHTIEPSVDPSSFVISLHSVSDAESNRSLYVVELTVPEMNSGEPFFTGGGECFVRVDGVKKKLRGPQVTAWIRRRIAVDKLHAAGPMRPEIVATISRIRQIFSAHGLEPGHLARFFQILNAPFQFELADWKTDESLLAWLNEEKITWIAKTFLVRREWIDGEDNQIHKAFYFDKDPKDFFKTVSEQSSNQYAEAYFMRLGQGKKWIKSDRQEVLFVLAVPLAEVSHQRTIYKYVCDFEGYPWNNPRTQIQTRAWARLLSNNSECAIFGCELSSEDSELLQSNEYFLNELVRDPRRRLSLHAWHPDDFAFDESESAAAVETEMIPQVIEFLKRHNLPWKCVRAT